MFAKRIVREVVRYVEYECSKKSFHERASQDKECRQFTIYPPDKFYPMTLDASRAHPNETRAEKMSRLGRNAMTIHSSNDYNREMDNVPAYKMAAKQHCPKIYEFAGEEEFAF